MKSSIKLKLAVFFLLSMPFAFLQAQHAVVASGGDGMGAGGSFTFSVGQVFYTTATHATGSATAGVQQAYEVYLLKTNEIKMPEVWVNIFPNPTSNFISIESIENMAGKLSFTLIDMQGKELLSAEPIGKSIQIQMEAYAAGTYMLNLRHQNGAIKSYKIVKR